MAKINILTAFGQEKGKEGTFISFYTQREAKYKNAPDSVFNNKKIPWEKVGMQSYLGLMDVPSPTIKEIDGYKSDKEVNPKPHDYSRDYLTFEAIEDGTFKFSNAITYSIDDGTTWVDLTANTDTPTIAAGNKIMWKATLVPSSSTGIGTFSATGNFNAYGNVMSLLYGDNFVGQTDLTGKDYTFFKLFFNNAKIVNTQNLILPATTLVYACYSNMFYGCTSLTTAPELPATALVYACYSNMFYGCTSLTTAPELPATALESGCYNSMFQNCTSLTAAPALSATTLAYADNCCQYMFCNCTSLTTAPALPATELATRCYYGMFNGCTSLTTAPELPATELATRCYYYMFYGCTSLTTAPELPATTLAENCYGSMFQNCTKLNYIKAMFTTTPSTTYTYNWVSGVSSTGTFVKNSAATWDVTGVNGVPTGWTVETASSEVK